MLDAEVTTLPFAVCWTDHEKSFFTNRKEGLIVRQLKERKHKNIEKNDRKKRGLKTPEVFGKAQNCIYLPPCHRQMGNTVTDIMKQRLY